MHLLPQNMIFFPQMHSMHATPSAASHLKHPLVRTCKSLTCSRRNCIKNCFLLKDNLTILDLKINKGLLIKNILTYNSPKMKILEFANSIDPDEVAHDEPPHLDLHCLPCSL